MKTIIVIPARYNSSRFKGKVLYPLLGKPVLQWVWENALKIGLTDDIIIATEDERVLKFSNSIGAKCIITSARCKSGTDRVWEVVKNKNFDIIINLQSDEPFIEKTIIRKAYKKIINENFDITTGVVPIDDENEIKNPNSVKAAIDKNGNAIYFSRAPIPYHHELSGLSKKIPYYKHIGFYIYRRKALEMFVNTKPSILENLERLEQLRSLTLGLKIGCVIVKESGPSIDTPDDIKKAIEYVKSKRR
jgi:3-deoxy-manno-octulosonate cytidylyltransferase (CMP-KDO synthetase)